MKKAKESKTAKRKLYAGIDLHGNNLVIGIVDADGQRLTCIKLPCEIYAVDKFLKPFQKELRSITVESTFNWYWLVDGLQEQGYHVLLANPSAIEQYSGLKHGDDKSDAFFLAELLRLGILPTGYIYDREMRPVRDMFRRRMLFVSKRTSLILSLKSLHCRTKGSALPLGEIKSMEPRNAAHLFDHPAEQAVAAMEKVHIDALGQSIEAMEKQVLEAADRIPNYAKVKTIPGIGKVLGTTIAMEIGDIGRFPSAEDFASYARTVPASRSSNGKKKAENNRKSGNRYLGWAFIEASNFIRQQDDNAKRWYDRKAAKTNKIIATKALACKLAKATWHILKNGTEYDAKRLFGLPPDKKVKQSSNLGERPSTSSQR